MARDEQGRVVGSPQSETQNVAQQEMQSETQQETQCEDTHQHNNYCTTSLYVANQPAESALSWEDIEEEVSAATGTCVCVMCINVCVRIWVGCVHDACVLLGVARRG